MDIFLERVSLPDIIDDALTVCRRQLDENGNRCIIEHASGTMQIDTDVTKLRQAVINLLANAAKFTRDGTVTVTTAAREQASETWIDIVVHDTGIDRKSTRLNSSH